MLLDLEGAGADVLKGKKADLQAALNAMLENGGGGSAEDAAPEPSKESEPQAETIQGEVSLSKQAEESASPVKEPIISGSNDHNGNSEEKKGDFDDSWGEPSAPAVTR